ncbi:MAG: carbamoyl phosphate synthase large subunit, partial [Polyangia bacterium]
LDELTGYVRRALKTQQDGDAAGNPLLLDRFLADAIEVDVDAVSDGRETIIGAVMEHIEEAGIHSGDSACALPPYSLPKITVETIASQVKALAQELGVVGLMNAQFAVTRAGEVYLLEVNPRASRTVPFVSKVTGQPLAKIAARVMAGRTLAELGARDFTTETAGHVAVKEAVFPFAKFPGTDTLLGPEMRSTGEVMGIDRDFAIAFAKAQLGAGTRLPDKGTVFISVRDEDKPAALEVAEKLVALGFGLVATHGTARYFGDHGVAAVGINKVLEGHPHCVDAILNGEIAMVINTTALAQAIRDSFSLRRSALTKDVPYFTTLAAARAAALGIAALRRGALDVRALQEYHP